MKNPFFKLSLLSVSLLSIMPAYAATPVDMQHNSLSALTPFLSETADIKLEEVNRNLDFNNTMHVRIRETYMGYPVWGGDAIIHVPNGKKTEMTLTGVSQAAAKNHGSMNGILYKDLAVDLKDAPALVFSAAQAQKALNTAVETYQHKVGGKPALKDQHSDLMVYVDGSNKAHWAYKVSFYAEPLQETALPAKPVYIMDAVTLHIYKQWDEIKTAKMVNVFGGGYGGNTKMGKLTYDGLANHLAKLSIQRHSFLPNCYMQNNDVVVRDKRRASQVSSFYCPKPDRLHNNVYWDGAFDSAHGGYSPANDAMYAGDVIKRMYQDWYHVPVLKKPDGSPMLLTMVVHLKMDNAYWDGEKMNFGDGVQAFYPLTSLGIAGHEVSHGFTEQHSNLNYEGQSGGMNESFSDMAAMAVEYYSLGSSSWQIGGEVYRGEGSLRYMDQPSKDCGGGTPGNECSIDNAGQYYDGLDVHYSSGVYNRFFYLLSTSSGWDARKAFDVMVQANSNYWTPASTFDSAACGVIQAAQDLSYNTTAVVNAFSAVSVDTSAC
ncbi:Zinc metalloproteinase [Aquicella siphonis]|uniref:Neutral metalloproteinase n=1 Tax=Aquicella siphonis TaxID=254247 RepID=A0A5E4PK12_9COXI|nr:M4 family metallopeptidase [Aquicella siphonis]VVC76652.1 Zinc metalloproteinase [Aquicella siphonis]